MITSKTHRVTYWCLGQHSRGRVRARRKISPNQFSIVRSRRLAVSGISQTYLPMSSCGQKEVSCQLTKHGQTRGTFFYHAIQLKRRRQRCSATDEQDTMDAVVLEDFRSPFVYSVMMSWAAMTKKQYAFQPQRLFMWYMMDNRWLFVWKLLFIQASSLVDAPMR